MKKYCNENGEIVAVTKCFSYELNTVRKAVRDIFDLSKCPITDLIKKGQTVIIKPNWIRESHQDKLEEWESVITHPSVITAVLEVVVEALDGDGKIIIADGPQTDSSFDKIMTHMGPDEWVSLGSNNGIEVEIIDLRDDEWITKDGMVINRKKLPGDLKGSVVVDLGKTSSYEGKPAPPLGYYGADYNRYETNWAHSNGRNLYKISRSVIEGDVFINLPKLKTHKKTGITVCLKNLVGINTYKNYLPHHSEGSPQQGGDQFPDNSFKNQIEHRIMAKLKPLFNKYPKLPILFVPFKALGKMIFGDTSKVIRSGNWYGNDTIWRTVLDLNRILLYANSDGSLRSGGIYNTKKYLTIVDGVIAGEANGPMSPDKVKANILIGGFNPLSVDCVAAKLMGFDYRKIAMLREAFNFKELPITDITYDEIKVISDYSPWNKRLLDISAKDVMHFKPHFGWTNHIELS